jgi:hypothetical protein
MPAGVLAVGLSLRDETAAALKMQQILHRGQRCLEGGVSTRLASIYVGSQIMLVALPGRHSAESSGGQSITSNDAGIRRRRLSTHPQFPVRRQPAILQKSVRRRVDARTKRRPAFVEIS